MFLHPANFVWWALAMLARLVDDCGGQQLRRIEFTDREAFQPCFLTARVAMKLRPPDVPYLDVDAIRPALAEQEHRHERSLLARRTKGKYDSVPSKFVAAKGSRVAARSRYVRLLRASGSRSSSGRASRISFLLACFVATRSIRAVP